MKKRKRSKRIRLLLLGGLSAGALAGCSPPSGPPVVSAENVYTNNFYVPGVGYYHAPFCAWYQIPYNYYDTQKRMYYWGGGWRPDPHQSITNVSSPSPQTALTAQAMRTDIPRGGFGCSSLHGGRYGGHYIHS
jgi:hypothetical protein